MNFLAEIQNFSENQISENAALKSFVCIHIGIYSKNHETTKNSSQQTTRGKKQLSSIFVVFH